MLKIIIFENYVIPSNFDFSDNFLYIYFFIKFVAFYSFSTLFGMEFVSSSYVLKKVYMNGVVIYRTYISEYNMDEHINTFLNIPELVKLESLFCSTDYKNIVAEGYRITSMYYFLTFVISNFD